MRIRMVLGKLACAIAFIIALSACRVGYGQSPDAAATPHPLYLGQVNNEVIIPFWRLIGPFPLRRSLTPLSLDPNGFQQDYLARIGYPERELSAQSTGLLCSIQNICRWYSAHGAAIPLFTLVPGRWPAAVYSVAQVDCTHDMDLALEFDSSEEIAIWLNGDLVRMISPGRSGGTAIKYLNIESIHLHKGGNTIVIKSDRAREGSQWAVMASLLPLPLARKKAIAMSDGYFIQNRILKVREPLTIPGPELCEHEASVVSIVDSSGTVVLTQQYAGFPATVETTHMAPGYYRASMSVGGTAIEDEFYIGDPNSVYQQLVSLQTKAGASTELAMLLDPLIRRYAILNESQYVHPAQADWQKKLLLVLRDGSAYASGGNTAAIEQSSGFHLREYQSVIDHTIQYYLYYIPRTHAAHMPLVVEMPYAVRVERPFLESALAIGWPKALDDLQRAADASGLSVAVIYGRGDVHDAPIGEADAFEAINDILSHFAIDRQKIYLFGTCEGGRRALMLAEHYPDTFAGVGVYGPTMGVAWPGRTPESQDTGLFSQVNSLASVPVHILQGEFDYDPPRDILNEFFGDLKKISSLSELTIVPDGMHGTSDAEKLLFPWLAQFKSGGSNTTLGADFDRAISKAR